MQNSEDFKISIHRVTPNYDDGVIIISKKFKVNFKNKRMPQDFLDTIMAKENNIFDKIGLTYNDLEGKTKDYLHQWVGKVPKEKPSETNRELFRTWQINQKFKNMNDPTKVNLSTELEKILDESFLVKVLGYENPKNK